MTCFPTNEGIVSLIYFGSSGAISLSSFGLGYLAKYYHYNTVGNFFYVITGIVAIPAALILSSHVLNSLSNKKRQ